MSSEVVTGDGDSDTDRSFLVISDPGRTSFLVRNLLNEETKRWWGEEHQIIHRQAELPLRTDGTLDVDVAQEWARNEDAALTLVITEIPRLGASGPKSVELHFVERLAIISLPVLGPVYVKRALRRAIDRSLVTVRRYSTDSIQRIHVGWRLELENDENNEENAAYITPRMTWAARVWTVLGMTMINEPLFSLPKLTAVFAAATAAGAFGIFFGSVWGIAAALPLWRLILVSTLAVLGLSTWLMVRNRLWDSRTGGPRLAVMYTVSTALSLLVSSLALYGALFVGLLLTALLVIDPTYMAQTEGLDGTLVDYAAVAWFSASMGTIAGAIGSNFNDETDLKNLTQGSRERARYPRDEAQR